ncbi:MAG: DegT/DnrJ/EryC1/StrS family aminotransferase, partial [Acidobacteriota bacterium]|nr:DegT/DnrJ/EryC1/StrS family aminotransferase [Acidobacteriota bacterium]
AHAMGVANGTDALWLALLACGIGAGDEVITVSSTFMATAEAITYCGATPVFVDIDEATYTMDSSQLESALTARTKAIIPVHLFGQCADMDPILAFANRHSLTVIEDAAQAHGAEYKGRKAGSMGRMGCFSFYPGKNLGALGEAGGLVTDDDELAARVRTLRDHGQARKYHHTMIGWNCRMDGIQGAVLQIKLCQLDRGNELRRQHAAVYTETLADVAGVTTPMAVEHGRHVFHIYAVRVQERDELLRALEAAGVSCGVHYPIPVHLQPAYQHLGYGPGSFPVSEQTSAEFLSLPMFPELTGEQLNYVTDAVKMSVAAAALA